MANVSRSPPDAGADATMFAACDRDADGHQWWTGGCGSAWGSGSGASRRSRNSGIPIVALTSKGEIQMNLTTSRLSGLGAKLTMLLGSASLLAMANAIAAQGQEVAQAPTAQAGPAEIPETVLITGSLIHGAVAVGVPVTNLNPRDFVTSGALTTAELFKTVPAARLEVTSSATASGARIERGARVNLRNLDLVGGTRSLMMIDGMRVPPQGDGVCELDPSIIPALSQERIDVLVDGASATYGSDAIAGVINIILKRNFDGAVSQLRYTEAAGGRNRYLASQLWGRTWDGGQITLSYEWYDESPIQGNAHSNFTVDHTPWGLDNRIPLGSSMPGTLSTGAPFSTVNNGPGTSASIGTACQNCWAIPHGTGSNFNPVSGGLGPTSPFSASTLNWAAFNNAANSGTNGVRNAFNPYLISWLDAAQQRNGAAITIDQRLTKDITFYGEAFYSNRRAQFVNPANLSPSIQDALVVGVPTFNPYYPTGGAPTNLRVSYNMHVEHPSLTGAYEVADHYRGGLHIGLPYGWNGDVYYSEMYDSSFSHVSGTTNKNAVSAALGWTIGTSAAIGSTPAIATWTKPAAVPYLNLFCDATQYKCNSDTTLAYITGVRTRDERFWINEKGAKFDGPLFELPGGTLRAAVGGTYTSYSFIFTNLENTGASTLIAPLLVDPLHRQVWAGFAELNIPVFSDSFNFPGFRRLQIEASWRHDQYSDVGGTSNPKISFDWTPSVDAGLTFSASWGTNFRAPSFGETSTLAKYTANIWNANDLQAQNSGIVINSDAQVGSAANRLKNPGATNIAGSGYINPLIGYSGTANPAGVALLGAASTATNMGFRNWLNTEGQTLHPENTNNYSLGVDFAPTTFLRGLDVRVTWYSIKINGILGGFPNPATNSFNSSNVGFSFMVPTDLAFLHQAAGDLRCHNNNTPGSTDPISSSTAGCPEFETMVQGFLNNPRTPVPQSALTRVLWISDGGIFNKGSLKLDGIDWTASYDWDWGSLGAWNTGIVGTYYLHRTTTFPAYHIFAGNTAPAFGAETRDDFHQTIASVGNVQQYGVAADAIGPVHYRARLGWSNGPWSITGFVNHDAHYFHTQTAPPNVNGQCTTPGGTLGGGTFPCLIEGYNNLQPATYLFDLSIGYDSADTPANEYLKNIGIQLVVQNLMDKHPAYQYRVSTGGGNPTAFDIQQSDQGRTISLILTKTW